MSGLAASRRAFGASRASELILNRLVLGVSMLGTPPEGPFRVGCAKVECAVVTRVEIRSKVPDGGPAAGR